MSRMEPNDTCVAWIDVAFVRRKVVIPDYSSIRFAKNWKEGEMLSPEARLGTIAVD